MALDVIMKDGRLYSNELRKLAKAMNQRMVELEKRDYKSPAYQAVQARLQALGRDRLHAAGRRFSETGYFKNQNELRQVEAMLRKFKEQETSTLKGYKAYRKRVLEGLQERYNYKNYGITDDDMLDFWESMPDDEKQRMYGSDETFIIATKFVIDQRKNRELLKRVEGLKPEDAAEYLKAVEQADISAEDIEKMRSLDAYEMVDVINAINNAKSITSALQSLDIDQKEYMDYKNKFRQGMGKL